MEVWKFDDADILTLSLLLGLFIYSYGANLIAGHFLVHTTSELCNQKLGRYQGDPESCNVDSLGK